MRVKGRYLVIAWTAVFLAAVGVIVVRTRAGFQMRDRVDRLEAHIESLEAMHGDLEAEIAAQSSRTLLAPKVEAFGLRFASDSEVRLLPVPGRP